MQQEPFPVASTPHEDLADFPAVWRTINEYKWGVLGIGLLAGIIGAYYGYSQEPTYLATLVLQVEPKSPHTVPVQDVYDPAGEAGYMGTQAHIIRSRELAGRVFDRLNLIEHPEFTDPPKSFSPIRALRSWREWLPFLPEAQPGPPPDPGVLREGMINGFIGRVGVQVLPGTQLIRVFFQSRYPQLAMDAANALGDVYIENSLETKLDATQRASRWLTDKLEEIRVALEKSEQDMQKFREQEQLVQVGGARGLVEEELIDASRRLREAQKARSELASTYQKIREARGDTRKLEEISTLLRDAIVQKAKEVLLNAQQSLRQTEERYGKLHPQNVAAQAAVEAAEEGYADQLRAAAEGIRATYEIAQENERVYSSLVATLKERIRLLDRRLYEQSVLEREVASNREIYNMFLRRFRETDTAGTYDQINANIVDKAILPRAPFAPNVPKIVGIWTVLGLLLGTLLAVIRHHLDEGIRSPEDAEAITGAPIVAVLPLVRGVSRKKSLPVLFRQNSRTPFAEGIRSARAGVHLSDVDHRMKRIMITSTVPSEGKSSVAGCLSLAFSAFERVLLLEADLRAPSVKDLFDLPKDRPGLVELLTGQAKADSCIVTHESGLSILPVTQLPLNPAEVLGSAAFEKLIETLSTRYDRLIIDTPPALAASDSLLVSRLVNAVVMVVKADATNRRAIGSAVKAFRQNKAPLFGTIINQVEHRHAAYYAGYHYAYGYYGKT